MKYWGVRGKERPWEREEDGIDLERERLLPYKKDGEVKERPWEKGNRRVILKIFSEKNDHCR